MNDPALGAFGNALGGRRHVGLQESHFRRRTVGGEVMAAGEMFFNAGVASDSKTGLHSHDAGNANRGSRTRPPTARSPRYTQPIRIDKTTPVRAAVLDGGMVGGYKMTLRLM